MARLPTLLVPACFMAAWPTAAGAKAPEGPVVRVEGGNIEGTKSVKNGVRMFGSIPYAAAPVGDLRWRPPRPVTAWGSAKRPADRLPPECAQVPIEEGSLAQPETARHSEDCLYLNVWTGADSARERRPVMVWLHGGGFMQGSSAPRMYDGGAMARRGVIFVSVNYRLGVFGFLAHTELSNESVRHVSGNYGVLDQIAALHWVQRNIEAFGGDPQNVTVIGQSAGSMSLNLLTASPLATGLFQRGIGETGAVMGMLTSSSLAEAETKGAAFAETMGAHSISQLRAIDADRLARAAGIVPGTFEPIADGWVLPTDTTTIYLAGMQNDVPLLIGSNRDENPLDPTVTAQGYRVMLQALFGDQGEALLALFPAGSDQEARQSSRQLMTRAMAQYPMNVWARLQARTGSASTYLYRFTRTSPVPPGRYLEQQITPELGAWHGSEIAYALDNLPMRDWPWSAEDRRLSDVMARYWVNFASSGNPNGHGLPEWPKFAVNPLQVMELGDRVEATPEPNLDTFMILDRRYFKVP